MVNIQFKNIPAIIVTPVWHSFRFLWCPVLASAGKIPLKKTGVFPKDNVFRVGSRATFCCVLPEGGVFKETDLTSYGSATTTTQINNQIYALTVDPNQASKFSCTIVKCGINNLDHGACAYFGCKYELVLCWTFWFLESWICQMLFLPLLRPAWWQGPSMWNPRSEISRVSLDSRKTRKQA